MAGAAAVPRKVRAIIEGWTDAQKAHLAAAVLNDVDPDPAVITEFFEALEPHHHDEVVMLSARRDEHDDVPI